MILFASFFFQISQSALVMDIKSKAVGGQAAHIELAPAEYKKLLRKVDYHVIPMLTILYLLSFLDRGEYQSGIDDTC
jgi:hypothetical protein